MPRTFKQILITIRLAINLAIPDSVSCFWAFLPLSTPLHVWIQGPQSYVYKGHNPINTRATILWIQGPQSYGYKGHNPLNSKANPMDTRANPMVTRAMSMDTRATILWIQGPQSFEYKGHNPSQIWSPWKVASATPWRLEGSGRSAHRSGAHGWSLGSAAQTVQGRWYLWFRLKELRKKDGHLVF